MDALGVIYARYGADVRGVCLRLAPEQGPEFGDDTCHAVFLVFLDTLDRYEERGKLRSWLFGIAARRCRSTRRQWWRRLSIHRRAGAASAGLAAPSATTPERIAAREEVVHALKGLPDAQREVLVLHALEGMDIAEVALALNITENAVSTRLYRARRAMEASR
jgi:RNA polymerase sigma factor (sigma-70 family)